MNRELQQTLLNYSRFLKSTKTNTVSNKLIDITDDILNHPLNKGQLSQLKNILEPYKQDGYIKKIINLI